jgi:hypothetical protein
VSLLPGSAPRLLKNPETCSGQIPTNGLWKLQNDRFQRPQHVFRQSSLTALENVDFTGCGSILFLLTCPIFFAAQTGPLVVGNPETCSGQVSTNGIWKPQNGRFQRPQHVFRQPSLTALKNADFTRDKKTEPRCAT